MAVIIEAEAAALDARPGAREHWEAYPPTAKRAFLRRVATAKRPETRARRVTQCANLVPRGDHIDQ